MHTLKKIPINTERNPTLTNSRYQNSYPLKIVPTGPIRKNRFSATWRLTLHRPNQRSLPWAEVKNMRIYVLMAHQIRVPKNSSPSTRKNLFTLAITRPYWWAWILCLPLFRKGHQTVTGLDSVDVLRDVPFNGLSFVSIWVVCG